MPRFPALAGNSGRTNIHCADPESTPILWSPGKTEQPEALPCGRVPAVRANRHDIRGWSSLKLQLTWQLPFSPSGSGSGPNPLALDLKQRQSPSWGEKPWKPCFFSVNRHHGSVYPQGPGQKLLWRSTDKVVHHSRTSGPSFQEKVSVFVWAGVFQKSGLRSTIACVLRVGIFVGNT